MNVVYRYKRGCKQSKIYVKMFKIQNKRERVKAGGVVPAGVSRF